MLNFSLPYFLDKQILNDIDQNQAEIIAGLRKLIEMESSDGKATKAQEFVLKELKEIDIGNLTPIEALNTLYQLQNKLKNRW